MLCANLQSLLQEYLVLIVQLEHQFRTSPEFTLQKFWFYVYPTLHTMSNLYSLVAEINKKARIAAEADDMDEFNEILVLEGLNKKNSIPDQIKGGGTLTTLVDRMKTMSG
jgi:gamma-tubulin complex component 2